MTTTLKCPECGVESEENEFSVLGKCGVCPYEASFYKRHKENEAEQQRREAVYRASIERELFLASLPDRLKALEERIENHVHAYLDTKPLPVPFDKKK